MAKWTDYPTKTTPVDTDDLMIYDATGKANKRVLFSGLWNWIVDKLTNAVISNLQTNNKTILGALNELNSNSSRVKFNGNINRITFRSGSTGVNNAYFDFFTDDGKRTTIGFYTDGTGGIQMMKDDTVIWSMKP